MLNKALEVNDEAILVDHEGYLVESADWNRDIAYAIAEKEGVELTDDVWEVIMFVREHYEVNQCIPEHRKLLQALLKNMARKKRRENMSTICFLMVMVSRPVRHAGMRVPLKLLLDL
jgi:tRNA 2-thiouridine synthesizing protein E